MQFILTKKTISYILHQVVFDDHDDSKFTVNTTLSTYIIYETVICPPFFYLVTFFNSFMFVVVFYFFKNLHNNIGCFIISLICTGFENMFQFTITPSKLLHCCCCFHHLHPLFVSKVLTFPPCLGVGRFWKAVAKLSRNA